MASYHVVEQGEHLAKIARQYGFSDYRTLWDNGQNAALRQQRQNPNVLLPGDRLYIPDKEAKVVSRPTDRQHTFQIKVQRLKLRLVLADLYEQPIANAPCELHVESEVHQLTTDGRGKIEQDIPSTAENARLIIKSKETALDALVIPIKIGHLDPVDALTGQQARLANLGYYIGPVDGQENPALRLAVEEFQCDHGLPVDGVCGPQTQDKLRSVHGC